MIWERVGRFRGLAVSAAAIRIDVLPLQDRIPPERLRLPEERGFLPFVEARFRILEAAAAGRQDLQIIDPYVSQPVFFILFGRQNERDCRLHRPLRRFEVYDLVCGAPKMKRSFNAL